MIDLTAKNIVVFDFLQISVEWVTALGTVGAVIVALALAIQANARDFLRVRKRRKLLLKIFCFELNSINAKLAIIIAGIIKTRKLLDQGLLSKGLMNSFLEHMCALDDYMQMRKVAGSIDQYIDFDDYNISQVIISQVKFYEHQSGILRLMIGELKVLVDRGEGGMVYVDSKFFQEIEKFSYKTFEGVVLGFKGVKMKRELIKFPDEVMDGMKTSRK